MDTRTRRGLGFLLCLVSAALMVTATVSQGVGLVIGTVGIMLVAVPPHDRDESA
jgi:hypothetical protein